MLRWLHGSTVIRPGVNGHADRMRRLLIRSVLSVLALAILALAWIVAGPWWARALDAVHTVRLATATSFSIREYSGYFHFFPGRNGALLPEARGSRGSTGPTRWNASAYSSIPAASSC